MLNELKTRLVNKIIEKNEGVLCKNNAIVVSTHSRTGRSPKDRFIVKDYNTENTVCWNSINQSISSEKFNYFWAKATEHLSTTETFTNNFSAGFAKHKINIKATTDLAWHMLFLTNLLEYIDENQTNWEIKVAAKLKLEPEIDNSKTDGIVIINFTDKKILIIGIHYAGEIKKSVFSVMNYLLPNENALSMHCAANEGINGDVALFFGLSGTGKTTLSADPQRQLIGDDEHIWSENNIYNIENGCYAKCFGLSLEKEPLIYNAIKEFTVLENVILNNEKEPIYDDASITLNTRAAYPLNYVSLKTKREGMQPKNIFMLSCDLFGVLPAISLLNINQAIFWFLNGYTAHIGSTEMGESGIKPTFSTCFGAPFFPRNPMTYAKMLEEKLKNKNINVFLVNTGYFGGSFDDVGKRYPLNVTREIIQAVLNTNINMLNFVDGPFKLQIPHLKLSDFEITNPIKAWIEPEQYIKAKEKFIKACLSHFSSLEIENSFKEKIIEENQLN